MKVSPLYDQILYFLHVLKPDTLHENKSSQYAQILEVTIRLNKKL